MLPDGRYDVFVVDVSRDEDVIVVELTLLDGQHKGDVVAVRVRGLRVDPLELLGVPATLVVADQQPRVEFN